MHILKGWWRGGTDGSWRKRAKNKQLGSFSLKTDRRYICIYVFSSLSRVCFPVRWPMAQFTISRVCCLDGYAEESLFDDLEVKPPATEAKPAPKQPPAETVGVSFSSSWCRCVTCDGKVGRAGRRAVSMCSVPQLHAGSELLCAVAAESRPPRAYATVGGMRGGSVRIPQLRVGSELLCTP